MHAAGEIWKDSCGRKSLDILDKWEYILHWVNATCLLELGGLFARTGLVLKRFA